MKRTNGNLTQDKLIEIKKESSQLFRDAYYKSKPEKCILCNEPKESYCNSHSVPQFSLKTIAENGKLLQSAALLNAASLEDKKGVKNSGVFHIICNSCDKLYFRDYENIDNIVKKPTDKIMGQIAVKNFLLQISKRLAEQNLYQEQFRKINRSITFESKLEDINLDLKDYFLDYEINKDVVDNNRKNAYHILFWDILPYKIPIASQGAITLKKDYKNYPVNNVYDTSPDICMQSFHLLTLPLENQSVVLAFYHKKDKLYSQLRHQLNSIKKEDVLKYLNYIIFKETENYYISTKIEEKIFSNKRLLELAAEHNELPNLGMVNRFCCKVPQKSIEVLV
jgi:hypothetical protein